MSLQSSGAKELTKHATEELNAPLNPNSAGAAQGGAAAAQPGFPRGKLTAIWRAACDKTHEVAAHITMAIRRAAESSEKEAASNARRDVAKYAMEKQLEMLQEQHRHEKEMLKKKGVTCIIEDCGARCDDGIALTRHIQEFHCGFKCPVEDCEAYFDNSSALEKHTQLCHRAMFACPEEGCKSSFSSTNDLCRHVVDCRANKFAKN